MNILIFIFQERNDLESSIIQNPIATTYSAEGSTTKKCKASMQIAIHQTNISQNTISPTLKNIHIRLYLILSQYFMNIIFYLLNKELLLFISITCSLKLLAQMYFYLEFLCAPTWDIRTYFNCQWIDVFVLKVYGFSGNLHYV